MAENQGKSQIDRKYLIFAFKIIGDFGVTLSAPVVIFVLIGQHLDTKFASSPWFTTAGFICAALISGKMIYKKAKKYGKQYQNLDK